MIQSFQHVIDLLYAAQDRRRTACRIVCGLLQKKPSNLLLGILEKSQSNLGVRFDSLLTKIYTTTNDQRIQWSVTDWTFQHFWTNPHEPLHSKFLGYLINPEEKHECGLFLLDELLTIFCEMDALPANKPFLTDNVRVLTETANIDLVITRNTEDFKYAIIIENKINGARNQDKQLQRYVRKIMDDGFTPSQIYVLYLPLTREKDPNHDDLEFIKNLGLHYRKISFDTIILKWLDFVHHKFQTTLFLFQCKAECNKTLLITEI